MAWTSPSEINASEGITAVTSYLNEVSYNWFGNMILITIWTIFLWGYIRAKGDNDIIGGFAVASYITFVIAILLWIIGVVSNLAFGFALGLTLVSSIALFIDKK